MQKDFENHARGPPQGAVSGMGAGLVALRENVHFPSKCEVFLWENHISQKTTVLQPLKEVT